MDSSGTWFGQKLKQFYLVTPIERMANLVEKLATDAYRPEIKTIRADWNF